MCVLCARRSGKPNQAVFCGISVITNSELIKKYLDIERNNDVFLIIARFMKMLMFTKL